MISRGSEIGWPAHCPDLNPLYFYIWALAQRQVYAAKPSTIAEVINVTKQFASESNEYVLKDVASDVQEMARFCHKVNDEPFPAYKEKAL